MSNSIILNFFYWFFAVASRRNLRIGLNFMEWAWHYFSIGYFLPRLLSPWHRDLTPYGLGFDLKRFMHVLGWNLISRVIGAILRAAVIIIGLVAEIVLAVAGVVVFVVWFTLPLVAAFLILLGIYTLISG